MVTSGTTHLISKEGYYQLKERLQSLKKDYATLRATVADARELKDADDYDMVEDDTRLAFLQKEIADLQYALRACKVVKRGLSNASVVQIGSKVKLQNGRTEMQCMLVSSLEADPSAGKISDQSPLGRALLGKVLNALVEVTAPHKRFLYRITSIE